MFESETARKDRFLTLLEKLEAEVKFKPEEKNQKFGFYDRIFNGVAEVERVGNASLRLKRENGLPLGTLMANHEIVECAKPGDHLMATIGRRNNLWYLIQIQMIGSYVRDSNHQKQMHLSIRTDLLSKMSEECQ